jgi:hypothetical protein
MGRHDIRKLVEARKGYFERHPDDVQILEAWLEENREELLVRLAQGNTLEPIKSTFPQAMEALRV